MGARINIRDIAAICQVSTATVSRALHDKPGIRPELRAHILQQVQELGYIPNATAQCMRSGHQDCVYLILRTGRSTDSLLSLPAREKFESLLGTTVHVQAIATGDDLIENLIRLQESDSPLLFVILGPCLTERSRFSKLTTPLLFVLADDAPRGYPMVVSDDFSGAQTMTESLIAAGHRSIALVTDSHDGITVGYQRRIAGYQDALKRHGISYDPSLLSVITVDVGNYLESSQRALEQATLPFMRRRGHIAHYNRPTAVFILNDFLAFTLTKVLWNAGIQVPRDISLAGFGGWKITQFAPAALRTWVQPLEDFVQATARAISCLIHNQPFPRTMDLPTTHPDGSHGVAIAASETTLMIPGYLRTGESVIAPSAHIQ